MINLINKTLLPAVLLLLLSGLASADNRDSAQRLNDARLEGQMWATYAVNRHLNPFDIDIKVVSGTATLSGSVEESVHKDLAEEIALGIDGVDKVDNQIRIEADRQPRANIRSERSFGDRVSDATTTTTVKSKLLWNRNTEGLSIGVSTLAGVVTLQGTVDSDASRQLAERLAENTDGVRAVKNELSIDAAHQRADQGRVVGDAISDSWISTKVKSTLLFSSAVPGSDISVSTVDGVVTLEGEVEHDAEKALAKELAKDVRGVKQVKDSALRVAAR